MPIVMSGGNLAPSLRGSMVLVASCCGDVSVARTGRLVRIEGKMNGSKYREILDGNLLENAQNPRQDNDSKHTAKTTGVASGQI